MEADVARDVALTTADNPFDPLDQYDEWLAYDLAQGYNTNAYVARLAHTSQELSDPVNDAIVEAAIDEIVEFNLLGNYIKVVSTDDA